MDKKRRKNETYVRITSNNKRIYRRFKGSETAEKDAWLRGVAARGNTYIVDGYRDEDKPIWDMLYQSGQSMVILDFINTWRKKVVKVIYGYTDPYDNDSRPLYALIWGVSPLWTAQMEHNVGSYLYRYVTEDELRNDSFWLDITGVFFVSDYPAKKEQKERIVQLSPCSLEFGAVKGNDFFADMLDINNQIQNKRMKELSENLPFC